MNSKKLLIKKILKPFYIINMLYGVTGKRVTRYGKIGLLCGMLTLHPRILLYISHKFMVYFPALCAILRD